MPNIVIRNLGVAGRQLPLAMLSQWQDVHLFNMHFPCITISPEIYLSYLIINSKISKRTDRMWDAKKRGLHSAHFWLSDFG